MAESFVIPEEKISDDERAEIHRIRKEMDCGKKYRLQDVLKEFHDMGFRVLGKEDVEKELARTKELYGMTPDEFYKAWKNDEVRGFRATKLACLYEFYRDEYERANG